MRGGGYNEILLFRAVYASGAYLVKDAAGSTVADAPADAVISLVQLEDVKLDFDESGGVKVTVGQHQAGGLFDAFMDAWNTASAGATGIPEVKYLDGASSRTSAGSDTLVAIVKGPLDEDDATKRLVRIVHCTVDPSSGSETLKHEESAKPALILNSVVTKANLVVPEELFGSGYGAAVGDQTIATGKHFKKASLAIT
jgi:hypothetical protein